jgi:hypothetical protein
MNHRSFHPLALFTLLLILAPMAHALDAARVAPALEAAFPRSVTYLDCPYHHSARTCVLIPGAKDVQNAYAAVSAFVRSVDGTSAIDTRGAPSSIAFVDRNTAYRIHLASSLARPGAIAATLTFAFEPSSTLRAGCQRRDTLFDYARRPDLDPAGYAAMATVIACHGADLVDARGRTPLVIAILNHNLDAVMTLLRGGADPNHITMAGWTPLLFAARNGTPAIVDALLQAGADPSYIAPDGATVEALEPFNARLHTTPAAAAEAVPTLPATLSTVPPASGLAPGSGAIGTALNPTTASTNRNAAVAAAGPQPSGAPSRGDAAARPTPIALPVVPLELLALAVILALAFLRSRRFRPETVSVSVNATQTDLPAMEVPGPFRRHRSDRRLDPARPHDDLPF